MKANTFGGGGAPELGDLRLLEDGRECRGALSFDGVPLETAKERQSGDGERAGVHESAGADIKANAREAVRVPKQPTRATAGSNCP